jgi:hypothetical protein
MLFDLRMRWRSTGIEVPFGRVAWVYTELKRRFGA